MESEGTSYHFGPPAMMSMSFLLNALVSAGMEEAAKRDGSSFMALSSAILTFLSSCRKDRECVGTRNSDKEAGYKNLFFTTEEQILVRLKL